MGRAFPRPRRRAARSSRRPTTRSASPSRGSASRGRRRSCAHRQHPARGAHRQRGRGGRARRARRARRRSPRATASASTRALVVGGRALASRTRCAWCGGAASSCRRRCRWAPGAMAAILGVELPAVERAVREAAQGEVVERREHQLAGPDRHRRPPHRGGARGRAGASERGRQKSVLLPVSAPFHCALMAPAAERLGRGARAAVACRATRASRSSATWTPGSRATADDVRPFLVRQVASPVRWTDCVAAAGAPRAPTAFVEVGPGRVLTGLLKRIVDGARGHAVEDPAGAREGAGRARRQWRARERRATLDGKVAIVTGGSRGIGARDRRGRWPRTARPW